jgi:hypothetical protein
MAIYRESQQIGGGNLDAMPFAVALTVRCAFVFRRNHEYVGGYKHGIVLQVVSYSVSSKMLYGPSPRRNR